MNNEKEKIICPNCGAKLIFSMPGGNVLICNECNKFYENKDNKPGKEVENPYNNEDKNTLN